MIYIYDDQVVWRGSDIHTDDGHHSYVSQSPASSQLRIYRGRGRRHAYAMCLVTVCWRFWVTTIAFSNLLLAMVVVASFF
jgi:hypothetical protein